MVQTCIVRLIRNSLAFVSWKDREAILPTIKAIYWAENADRQRPVEGFLHRTNTLDDDGPETPCHMNN